MPSTTLTIAETLAQFAAAQDYDALPAPIREKARTHLLDSVGVALAATGFEFARRAYEGLSRFGGGEHQVIGMPGRLPLRDAVCMNGILVHGIEYDDTSILGRIHPSAFCAPAALGAGAFARASGKAMLAAYVAGVECAIRVGAAAKGGFSPAGFNATGVVGGFGAVMTAGKLLGLDTDRLAAAQGIVYTTAAGNREFVATDGWTKRLDPAWAAVSGVTAASLAQSGYMASPTPYEGRYGLYRVYLEHEVTAQDIELITAGLGDEWHFGALSLKGLASCYFNHPLINATIAIMNRHDLVPGSIRSICVYLPRAAIDTVCEPSAAKYAPTDLAGALFSAYYNVASAAVRRRLTLDELQPEALADPEVLALARKVSYAIDAESTFPRHYSGAVEIVTMDGRTYSDREDVNKGSSEQPMSQAEVEVKFMDNACRVIPRARAQAMMDAILDIERVADVSELPLAADS
ncbi:MAG: MmgE/PrpD family protein [Betaproteobacteria bacterium]|nr:MmgE/PrpD family protein [Betaproteobacteria bacterium]